MSGKELVIGLLLLVAVILLWALPIKKRPVAVQVEPASVGVPVEKMPDQKLWIMKTQNDSPMYRWAVAKRNWEKAEEQYTRETVDAEKKRHDAIMAYIAAEDELKAAAGESNDKQ